MSNKKPIKSTRLISIKEKKIRGVLVKLCQFLVKFCSCFNPIWGEFSSPFSSLCFYAKLATPFLPFHHYFQFCSAVYVRRLMRGQLALQKNSEILPDFTQQLLSRKLLPQDEVRVNEVHFRDVTKFQILTYQAIQDTLYLRRAFGTPESFKVPLECDAILSNKSRQISR